MADDSVDIEGYDGPVDDGPSFGGTRSSSSRAGIPTPGRRGGKKTLAPPSGAKSGKRSRSMSGHGFIPGIKLDPREIARSVSSLLAISVIGVIVVAAILYYTFTTYAAGDTMQFYGALVAAMAVVLLVSYLAVKLLNTTDQ
ncbi:MAG: hypothetical protein WBZ29_17915 [Methanocella sp.]